MGVMTGFLEGETIDGHYRILRALGEGAMGAVFLAEDPEGNEVAVKVVLDRAPDTLRAPQRFFREVKTLNKLQHPNIVALLDFGQDMKHQLSYMVMEVMRGDDLSLLVGMGRSEPELALLVAEQVGAGLELAHGQGIIHRDLKPANVMLCPQNDGSVKAMILDFGLAMLMDADTRLTKTGTAPGTVNYMTPEQLIGQKADSRTDVYGVGIILYEMLTGHGAFRGGNQTEIALAILNGPPLRNVSDLAPDIPRPIGDFVSDMLQRKPENRPPTAISVSERAKRIRQQLGYGDYRVNHIGPAEKPRQSWSLRPRVAKP